MHSTDFDAFSALLDDVWSLKAQAITGGAKAMFFRALAAYPIEVVQGGLSAHLADPKRGSFLPMPADVIAQIDRAIADDGRPGAEEAWALAMRSTDEADTIVWTAEIAEAFGVASPVLQAGDEVGARMAFREVYGRLVEDARRDRRAPQWTPSLGFDPELRSRAIESAVSRGLLPASSAPMLPAPRGEVPLLTHAAGLDESDGGIPDSARAALLTLRAWLTAPKDETSDDVRAKAETEARRKAAALQVAAYSETIQ